MNWTLIRKSGRLHPTAPRTRQCTLVPLTDPAISLIETMQVLNGSTPYVFASPRRTNSADTNAEQQRNPIRPDSVGTALTRALDDIGLGHFSSHDLRRTAATNISALGYGDDLIGRILNHKNRTVTARYNRHSYLDEKREALAKWSARLQTICVQQPE